LRTMALNVPVAAVHSGLGVGWTKNWLTSASALNSSASSGMASSSSSSRFNSIGNDGGAGGGSGADTGAGACGGAYPEGGGVARAEDCAGVGADGWGAGENVCEGAWGVGESACGAGAVAGARGGECEGAGMGATGVGRGAVVAAGWGAGRGPAFNGAFPCGVAPLVPAGGRGSCVRPAGCWGGRGAVAAGVGAGATDELCAAGEPFCCGLAGAVVEVGAAGAVPSVWASGVTVAEAPLSSESRASALKTLEQRPQRT
jgi:hypothetical protein